MGMVMTVVVVVPVGIEAEGGRAVESWWEWEVGEVGGVVGGAWVVDLSLGVD